MRVKRVTSIREVLLFFLVWGVNDHLSSPWQDSGTCVDLHGVAKYVGSKAGCIQSSEQEPCHLIDP